MDSDQLAPESDVAEADARYAAYLLRVWRSERGDWRMVVQVIGAEERHGFTDWAALVQHVCDSLAPRAP